MVVLISSEGEIVREVNDSYATEAATVVFHEQYTLKNMDSFVVNGSTVISGYEDENGMIPVTVTIDYSAQNGFGGTNRDEKRIKIQYSTEDGFYYRSNGSRIYY